MICSLDSNYIQRFNHCNIVYEAFNNKKCFRELLEFLVQIFFGIIYVVVGIFELGLNVRFGI